jgi:hypothetical protein
MSDLETCRDRLWEIVDELETRYHQSDITGAFKIVSDQLSDDYKQMLEGGFEE